jgi:Domain of unknown function (DUF3473)
MPDAKMNLHELQTPSGTIWEFPPSVQRIAGVNCPVSGGGYFRFYPAWFTRRLLRRINAAQQPFMFYLHPWEIDPQQPRLQAGTATARMRHYVNLKTTQEKLKTLLNEFRFGTISQTIAALCGQPQLAAAV